MTSNVFLKVLGGGNIMKVLDYLLDLQMMDVSVSDIMLGTDLSRKTVDKIMDNFIGSGVVVKTRNIGKTQMFKLNGSNPIVQKLFDINKIVLKQQENKLQQSLGTFS